MNDERIELIESVINSSCYTIEITEEIETGDKIIKIQETYTNKIVCINMYELLNLLKHYTGANKILLINDEIQTANDMIPLF